MNKEDLNEINQLIVDHSIEGMIITDLDSNILKVNSAFCKISGFTFDEILGKKTNIFKSGKHPTEFYLKLWNELLTRGEWQGEIWNKRKNGEVYPGWLTIRIIRDRSGKATYYLAVFSEISSLEYLPEAVFIIEGNGLIKYANQWSAKVLGVTEKSSLTGLNLVDYIDDSIKDLFKERIRHATQGKINTLYEWAMTWIDGQIRFFESISVPIIFAGTQFVQVILRDVTNMKEGIERLRENEQRLHFMAYYDQLTQLPNRVSLREWMPQIIQVDQSSYQKAVVMYIGLEGISLVENVYEYSLGERLIKESVARIQGFLQGKDSLFRFGEKDFVAILSYESNMQTIMDTAENIVQAFRNPFIEDGYEFHVHVNIGINTHLNSEDDAKTSIQDAYFTFLRAKEIGKNTFSVSSPDMNHQTYRTLTLQNDLYKAMSQKELELYYQPRINPFTYQIMSAEALLRWNHPTLGMIYPGEFIPLAEESDLILSIGEWVMRQACKQNKEWHDAGLNRIPISINISGKQLMQKDFTDVVEKVLKETGLEEEWLEIEVTESTIFTNEEAITNMISKLRELGIKISIDDFGTGYSSLSRLTQLKCNTIKVDQSFIKNMEENPDDRIITEVIIHLSHMLGMNIVAEGVETIQQLEFLRGKQCNEVQGYLFSQPIPGDDFERLLRLGQVQI